MVDDKYYNFKCTINSDSNGNSIEPYVTEYDFMCDISNPVKKDMFYLVGYGTQLSKCDRDNDDIVYMNNTGYFFKIRNINDYIPMISNEELLLCVEDKLNWQSTGKRKYEHTILDDIYNTYFSYTQENVMFGAYNIVASEIAKRAFNKQL